MNNQEEYDLLCQVLGKPASIQKSYLGCHIGVWPLTTQQAINQFRKSGLWVRKYPQGSGYIISNGAGLRLDVFNTRNEYFTHNTGEVQQ